MAARLVPSPFDTEVFGIACGRLEVGGDRVDEAALDALMEEAKGRGFRHLTARLPSEAVGVCRSLERRGFSYTMCSLELEKASTPVGHVDPRIERFRLEDASRLVEMTVEAFKGGTRFHFEPAFSEAGVSELHARWIRNLIADESVEVFVCREAEALIGYVTVSVAEQTRRGHIGLIAVDAAKRRSGVGEALIRGAEWALDSRLDLVSVVTESINVGALSLYARVGFRPRRSWTVFHWRV